ncbi:MAG: hypothetical protein V7749_02845 [Cocleimonas sp.]
MQKQEIINVLREVRDSHIIWVKQGKIIVDGINLDRLEEPVAYDECDFSHWCESSKNKISAFSWFDEVQEIHTKLHQVHSDLFFGSIRKYKPKTINELVESFELLKTESKSFKEKLDQAESDLYKMSDDNFEDLVIKSNSDYVAPITENSSISEESEDNTSQDLDHKIDATTNHPNTEIKETEEHSRKQSDHDSMMNNIDIDIYDNYRNPFDELESVVAVSVETSNEHEAIEENKIIDTEFVLSKNEIHEMIPMINTDVNIKRRISLKEQNIIQLQQEKELILLEVNHLEQTQNLTQKSVEQLEQYYASKQEEVELEQKDNGGFIAFKNNAKKQVEDELIDIQEKQSTLNKNIQDLEKQNIEDELEQDEYNKEVSLVKQFEDLKSNKNRSLEELQIYKKSREEDLVKLKEQLLLLEEEITGMDQDIDQKQQVLLDLEEKETLKNKERSSQKAEQDKSKHERNDKIADMQEELDQLSEDEQEKHTELNTIVFQIDELNKNGSTLLEANSDELIDLEQQQELKRKKLSKTDALKSSKHEEIKDIEILIIGLERSLENLKIEQKQIEEDESELATTE